MAILQALVRPWLRDSDSPEQLAVKRAFIPAFFFSSIVLLVPNLAVRQYGTAYGAGTLWLQAVLGIPLIYAFFTGSFPKVLAECAALGATCGLILVDWYQAAGLRQRMWPVVVLVMDVLLAGGARKPVQLGCMHGTLLWLCASGIEDVARLGLWDVPHWADTPAAKFNEQWGCADPPCGKDVTDAVMAFNVQLLVLYVDFIVTRSFAEGQRREQAVTLAAVRTAERFAACLVDFDLESAELALGTDDAQALPNNLFCSFEQLLYNLAGYRPYLPASVFVPVSTYVGNDGRTEERGDATMHTAEWDSASEGSSQEARTGTDGDVEEPSPRSQGHPCDMLCFAGSPTQEMLSSPRAGSPTPTVFSSGVRQAPQEFDSNPLVPTFSFVHPVATTAVMSAASLPFSDQELPQRGAGRTFRLQRQWHSAQQKRVTLLATNRRGFLPAVARARADEVQGWLQGSVGFFSSTVSAQHGVVDVLSADHFCASFGAATRALGAHRTAAVRCAAHLRDAAPAEGVALDQLRRTSAVCSGNALCGDFGNSAAQRYMVIGAVSSFIHSAERAAAAWNVGVLCDDAAHDGVSDLWDCRLRAAAQMARRLAERRVFLWEVLEEKDDLPRSCSEWMYEMAAASRNPWEGYNEAVRTWCKGRVTAALEAVAAAITDAEEGTPPQKALVAARARMLAGALPPACRLVVAPADDSITLGGTVRSHRGSVGSVATTAETRTSLNAAFDHPVQRGPAVARGSVASSEASSRRSTVMRGPTFRSRLLSAAPSGATDERVLTGVS
eukprot:TRINITY_DN31760_c0_g1_i1.p1 TRINITY_DN31760_c0_g1~~TRINITY_DN31760_c0_g1_i1.p1  ORF type:complete len:783 (+),score=118.01 TRINITY_DN31760_c0_g1_i1:76-2424(+)